MVIAYQVDEISHTWSAAHFVDQSHNYFQFTGKVSTLTHFLLEPGCEDYSFLDQVLQDFEHGLDFILTDSTDMPELNVSSDDTDAMPFSASSGHPCSVISISDNSRPHLAPSIRSHKLWFQAMALL